MRIGVTFPQIEFGNDPVAIRDYAQTIEGLGYTHFLAYDHVLGADASVRPGWTGSYASDNPFHEVFVLLGYLAGLTTSLELVTGVLILPQRQTALVAKQAAEIDVLSGGRLRLGVGVGWNEVEYEGLDKDFRNRGARSEEQIALLRALWTSPVITFDGRWERIDAAGINPLPCSDRFPSGSAATPRRPCAGWDSSGTAGSRGGSRTRGCARPWRAFTITLAKPVVILTPSGWSRSSTSDAELPTSGALSSPAGATWAPPTSA